MIDAAVRAALLQALASEHAPTTVRDPREAARVHLADSLVALEVPEVRAARVLADLGSGAGFPGLALAAALPEAQVVCVESVRRKAEFIAKAASAAGLRNVEVVAARAEEWRDGLGRCDVVCARALAALPVLVEYAAPLLREGGLGVFWKGRVEVEEREDGSAAAGVVGLCEERVLPVRPFPGSRDRTLHLYRKVRATPDRFPRRAGMATKRPLSAKSA